MLQSGRKTYITRSRPILKVVEGQLKDKKFGDTMSGLLLKRGRAGLQFFPESLLGLI